MVVAVEDKYLSGVSHASCGISAASLNMSSRMAFLLIRYVCMSVLTEIFEEYLFHTHLQNTSLPSCSGLLKEFISVFRIRSQSIGWVMSLNLNSILIAAINPDGYWAVIDE